MGRPIEPGLLRIFRYFAGVAMVYFAIIWGYALTTADYRGSIYIQSLLNFAINFLLSVYLSWPWLEHKLKQWYLPFSLVTYIGATVFTNLIYLIDLQTIDLYLVIARSWVLMPILLVLLVVIAWQYSFRAVLLFSMFTNASELLIFIYILPEINFETLPILGLPFIRAFAFGIVGNIVVHLMDTQRQQKRKLIQANIQLGQHANTLEQLATSRERNRIARDLHDTLAHTLSGLAVNLEGIKAILPVGQGDVLAMLDNALQVTRTGLDETRRTLQDLRARPLDDLGLELALRKLIQAIADRGALEAVVEISPGLPNLPPDVEQSIYRIVQEAMENIVRHADARQVSVSLKAIDHQVELLVEDDGRGFDPRDTSMNSQFGIQGMRERAAVVGATISVTSEVKKGTAIRFIWEKLDDQSADL